MRTLAAGPPATSVCVPDAEFFGRRKAGSIDWGSTDDERLRERTDLGKLLQLFNFNELEHA